MMDINVVYVTVGTTKFEALIQTIVSNAALQILKLRKCHKLVLQLGTSEPLSAERVQQILNDFNIHVEQYTFRPNQADIAAANLVIGHGGAGTCMDILNNNKPGLIVVNDTLMDNHQLELAQQLAQENYLFYCNLSEVVTQLETLNFATLKPYEKSTANMCKLVQAINELMTNR